MPLGYITPVRMVVYRLMFYQIFVYFLFNDSSELLEIMFDGRALHSSVIIGEKTFFRMCWTCV